MLNITPNDWILDVESSLDHKTIWVVCVRHVNSGIAAHFFHANDFMDFFGHKKNARFIGHNVLGFDKPILERVWSIQCKAFDWVDTLVLSRLYKPDIESVEVPKKPHSLEAWGHRVGELKSNFNDFSKLSSEMVKYCHQDCLVAEKVYRFLVLNYAPGQETAIDLEHDVASIIQKQEENGFKFASKEAEEFKDELKIEYAFAEETLINQFEPTIKVLKTKTKTIPFNPGSRTQIAERLQARGWKPKVFSPTGKPVVDEGSLADAVTQGITDAEPFLEFFLLRKRISEVEGWLKAVGEDGRIHGYVNSNGAVTGRMTHSGPNMAQIPSVNAPYGKECRSFFTVPVGRRLVGIDASGLELRMLAHYMRDPAYVETVVNGNKADGTDIHTVNMRALGIDDRDVAKTFIYAWLYGAGAEKIAKILGCTVAQAKKKIEQFLNATPALKKLKEKVSRLANQGYLPGLDGRRLYVRSPHAALNTLLQGGGAIVMKKALVLFEKALKQLDIPHWFVANVHDEWQVECWPEDAKQVGELGVIAIEVAGKDFNLRCPLTGEYGIGINWSETH